MASFDNVDYIEPALACVHVNAFISSHGQIRFLGGKLVILDIMHLINLGSQDQITAGVLGKKLCYQWNTAGCHLKQLVLG